LAVSLPCSLAICDTHTRAFMHACINACVQMSTVRVPMVLVGTKFDLAQAGRQVPAAEGEDMGHTMDIPWFEVSTRWRVNTSACFHQMVREIRFLDADFRARAPAASRTIGVGGATVAGSSTATGTGTSPQGTVTNVCIIL